MHTTPFHIAIKQQFIYVIHYDRIFVQLQYMFFSGSLLLITDSLPLKKTQNDHTAVIINTG